MRLCADMKVATCTLMPAMIEAHIPAKAQRCLIRSNIADPLGYRGATERCERPFIEPDLAGACRPGNVYGCVMPSLMDALSNIVSASTTWPPRVRAAADLAGLSMWRLDLGRRGIIRGRREQ
jgi:hypothetical protein